MKKRILHNLWTQT